MEKQIEKLRPWRSNHTHQGVVIRSDAPIAARVNDQYGRDVLIHILNVLLKDKHLEDLRAIDLGCLEGHYSDILCSLNFKEVVSIDLSEGHVKRANFLLKELKKYLVSPYPIAELQVKPLKPHRGNLPSGLLYSPSDESVFERCAFRLNPAAVYQVLKVYNSDGIITYDTPGGYSYNSNLIVTKNRLPGLVEELNRVNNIQGVRFYEWDGSSVDSYDFSRRVEARITRFLICISHNLFEAIRRLAKRRKPT